MASRQIALLRGINVGKAKRVAMADLRALFEKLGYVDVRTLLNSGNVVFSVPETSTVEPAPRIETAIAEATGHRVRVTVIGAEELAEIVANNPLRDVATDPSRLLISVFNHPADRGRVVPLTQQDWTPDRLALGDRVAYVWCAEGILESRLAQALGRALGDSVTSRNLTTMSKLKVLAEER